MVLAQRRGFSLIELVIVVVIIGIIGAIAIPRMSRGAEGAGDAALRGNLAVLRGAIDLFATEHGGTLPTLAQLNANPSVLTGYTNEVPPFTISGTKTATEIYGPYLRVVPTLPVGAQKGQTAFHSGVLGAAGFGWHYTVASGAIVANCTNAEVDAKGTQYNAY